QDSISRTLRRLSRSRPRLSGIEIERGRLRRTGLGGFSIRSLSRLTRRNRARQDLVLNFFSSTKCGYCGAGVCCYLPSRWTVSQPMASGGREPPVPALFTDALKHSRFYRPRQRRGRRLL